MNSRPQMADMDSSDDRLLLLLFNETVCGVRQQRHVHLMSSYSVDRRRWSRNEKAARPEAEVVNDDHFNPTFLHGCFGLGTVHRGTQEE